MFEVINNFKESQSYQQKFMSQAGPEHDSFEDLLRELKLEIESSQDHIK